MIIENNVTNILEIKKSKFITLLIKIDDINNVDKYLNDIKKEYKDATHYCYAYIIDNYKKFSDDNEPGGTAGSPIMQVLEKNNLNYVLCIVIRYFGGIKLGAGGLVRAYSKSVVECLNNSEIIKLVKGKNIIIKFNYDKINTIDNILKDSLIINKCFDEVITYEVNIEEDTISKLEGVCDVIVNSDVYIEKSR